MGWDFFFVYSHHFCISSIQHPYYITSSYTYQFFEKCYICSSLQYRSALVVAQMRNIIFILLLRGLPQGRCPSEAVCSKMELTSLVSAFFHP